LDGSPDAWQRFLTDGVVDSQQRIVSLGLVKQNRVYNLWLTRLFLNGQTDSSFGQFGKKFISLRLNNPQLVNGK
jgi:carbohydrate-selective porin OprB